MYTTFSALSASPKALTGPELANGI
jgi:hypothetical protein